MSLSYFTRGWIKGFRENHSTNLCLPYLTDKILKGFDEGLLTGMILIDLQKVFDTIDHEILLQKLKAIRFSKGTLQWVRSYLSERKFLVNIESRLWFWKNFLWGTTRVYLRSPFVLDLCERYSTSSEINFTFICRWFMHLVPTQRNIWNWKTP